MGYGNHDDRIRLTDNLARIREKIGARGKSQEVTMKRIEELVVAEMRLNRVVQEEKQESTTYTDVREEVLKGVATILKGVITLLEEV